MDTLNELFDSTSSNGNGDSSVTETTEKVEEVTTEETKTEDAETPEKSEETEKEVKETESSKDKVEKPSIDWDSADNPHKAEAEALKKENKAFEKRWKDTHAWGNEEHKKHLEAQAKLKEYGETIEEHPPEDIDKIVNEFETKMKISQELAKNQFGEEHLESNIYAEDSVWQRALQHDPVYSFRVKTADSPVHEALKVVKEYEFFSKYGNEPEKITDNIKKEVEAELREKITKELHDKLKKKDEIPQTLSDVTSTEVSKETEQVHKPLGEVFAQRG